MPVAAQGNLVQVSDFAWNRSNKLFTVPEHRAWRLVSLWAKLVTTATAGNRQLDVLILDHLGNLVGKYAAGAVQVASRVQYYIFAPGHPQETAFTPAATEGVMLRQLGAELWLLGGWRVRVWDSAAIAATTDDLSVTLLVDERS